MARPKHIFPELFTGGELTTATGISLRNVQFLRDQSLGPFATRDQAGGLYQEDTLAELAMIAGCYGAGFPLSLSAALVAAFLLENPNHPAARFCRLDSFQPDVSRLGQLWFQRHVEFRELLKNPGSDLTSGHDQDATLVVADRQFVLSGTRGKPRLRSMEGPGVDPNGPFPLGRMVDFHRGKEPTFVEFTDEPFFRRVSEAELEAGIVVAPEVVEGQIRYQSTVWNALGVTTVNLSLSIRCAFDRVYELRKAKTPLRRLCTGSPWLNGLTIGTRGPDDGPVPIRAYRSFHPNQFGHNATGAALARRVRTLDWTRLEATEPTIDPSAFVGRWTGTIQGAGRQFTADVELELTDGRLVGTIAHPDLPCYGSTTESTRVADQLLLVTVYTAGSACVDGGTHRLTARGADELLYEWLAPDSNRIDSGTLRRVAATTPPAVTEPTGSIVITPTPAGGSTIPGQ